MELSSLLIVIAVVGSRLILPLFIPRYPLPAILACLVVDGLDQTIFQTFTTLNLDNYQSYDKALDIYYLSVAYLSTYRNWTNKMAFQVSQFLFYYRMVGVALYETYHSGIILLIFPNTFEYFFIFISAAALFYKMKRFSKRFLIASAAFIWIFIKLPQEYWIHVAHLDATDFIKENIFHVSTDTSWIDAISQNLWVIPVTGIISLILGILIYKISKRLPKPDHKFEFRADVAEKLAPIGISGTFIKNLLIRKRDFAEKIVFVAIVSIIFAGVFPSFEPSYIKLSLGVAFVILANAGISYAIIKYSKATDAILDKFSFMFVLNIVIAFVFSTIMAGESQVQYFIILLLAYVLTLITVLYDRFKPYYAARFK